MHLQRMWQLRCVFLIVINTAVQLKSLPSCAPPCLYYSNQTAINVVELKTNRSSTVISDLRHAVALEVDFSREQLFWSDISDKAIRKVNLTSGQVTDVVTRDLGQVEGIAVDWVGGVLYWTDYWNERIEVSGLDGFDRMVLLSENHENPRDIAVDVKRRLIFWTDWSPIEPRIERATTSGGNRTVIINDPRIVRWPNGVTVDESKKILFWVDAFYDHVVSCDYFGGKISILAPSVHPFGIAVLGDQLYWSDVVNSTIFSRSRHSSSVIQNFGRLSSQGMYAVAVFDSSVQPKANTSSVCAGNNGGCSHLCLQSPEGPKCTCPNGIALQPDGKTCNKEFKKFVIFADQRNKEIYQLSLDSYPAFQVTLPLQNLSQPIALDLDPYQSHIYWTDISTHSISRAALNGSFQEVIIKHNTPTPAGLAVDPIGRNIYWTDEQTNQIEVAKLDGSYRRVLFYDEIDHPRDVVLDTDNGLMYWCDWGVDEKIERGTMDGHNRTVLVQTGGTSPLGLALDSNHRRLYWVASPGSLAYLDLDNGVTVNVLSGASSLGVAFGLTLDQTYLYWTDVPTRGIYRAEKPTGGNITKILPWLGVPGDIRAYNMGSHRQSVQHPCHQNNGGCSYLCLLRPGGYSCACPDLIQPDRPCDVSSSPSFAHSRNPSPSSVLASTPSIFALKSSLAAVISSTPQVPYTSKAVKATAFANVLSAFVTPSPSVTPSHTMTFSSSVTTSHTVTPSTSVTPSYKMTFSSVTPSHTVTPSPSVIPSHTVTFSYSVTTPHTVTPSPSVTAFHSVTFSSDVTLVPFNKVFSHDVTSSYYATLSSTNILSTVVQPSSFVSSIDLSGSLAPSLSSTSSSVSPTSPFKTTTNQISCNSAYNSLTPMSSLPSVKSLPVTSSSPHLSNITSVSISSSRPLSSRSSVSTTQPPLMGICDSLPCKNGGTCVVGTSEGYTCSCTDGYAGKNCLSYVGNDTVTLSFKMNIEEWKENVFKESMSKALTTFCQQNDCFFQNRLASVHTAKKRATQPRDFLPRDVIILGKPISLPEMVTVSASIILQSDQSQIKPLVMPRVVLCRFARDSRENIGRLMGNYSVLFVNAERIPNCGGDLNLLSTGRPLTTKAVAGSSRASASSSLGGIQAGIVIAVIAVLGIAGAIVYFFRRRIHKTPHKTFRNEEGGNVSSFGNPCYDEDLAQENGAEQLSTATPSDVFQEMDTGCSNPSYDIPSFYLSADPTMEALTNEKRVRMHPISIPLTDVDHDNIEGNQKNEAGVSFANPEYDAVEVLPSSVQWVDYS